MRSMGKLDFQEKLIQTGKGAGTDALLKRLKSLHQKLAVLEQETTDLRSLDPIRKPLINAIILHHKDRGVKAYAACCLADLLRLYAPDAPFTGEELRDIFSFFVHQLRSNLKQVASTVRPLAPSKNKANEASQSQSQLSQTQASQRITDVPYFTEYSYLLQSLATIKSIVLVSDVPGGEELIVSYFEAFIDIVRPDMNKTLIRHLVDILVACLEESRSIPSGVMDILIAQFKDHASRPETPSFQLAADVCNQTAERLQRHVLAHFSEIQIAHGRNPTSDDLVTLTESHELLLTMFRHCPELLLNVVPQLEDNLRLADEVPLRELSTKTLGAMFGARPVTGAKEITKAYPSAWRAWLGRRVDKALQVRLAWVEATKEILLNHSELRSELETGLIDRVHDSDEKVRAATCKVIGTLDYETALRHVSLQTLTAVGGRMSDKKSSVRAEACSAMAKLWTLAYSEIEANDAEAIEHFAWIPQMMLHSTCKKDATLDLRTQVSSTIKNQILPLSSNDDEQAWVDRLLLVASHVDEPAFKALERITGLRGFSKGSSPYKVFIDFCEANNGGVIDGDVKQVQARLTFVCDVIANQLFPDAAKAKRDLQAFADANDPRLYKLFKTCADLLTDVKTMVKARNELLRRIEQSHTSILETFTTLIDAASWTLLNHSSIPPLLKRLQKPDPAHPKTSELAAKFLSLIAKEGAPMYKSHVDELVIVMGETKNQRLGEVAFQALAAVCKWNKECAPTDKKAVEKASKAVLEGTPRQAKFAARFIGYSRIPTTSGKLMDKIIDSFSKAPTGRKVTYLTALAEMARTSSAAFNDRSGELLPLIQEKILNVVSPSSEEEKEEWITEDELEDLDRCKVIALRVLTHYALTNYKDSSALEILQPVLNVLMSVLTNEGMVTEDTSEGGRARVHLRLRAGLCFLKLAHVRPYDKAITPYFETITYLMQDPIYQVRYRFLLKLGEILPAQRMLPRWNIIPALAAKDPEDDNILLSIMAAIVRQCKSLSKEDRIERVEMPFARLLLMLTHHPDLTWDVTGLKDIARFIELFIDCIADRDNVPLLFHIATKLKTVRDAAEDQSDNLYRLSELAQLILRNRASVQGWPLSPSTTTYSGKVRLPRDIFNNLTDPEAVQRVVKTVYLPEEIARWAQSLGRKPITNSGPSRKADPTAEPKKRSRPAKSAPRKKRRSTGSRDETEDEESESESEEEEEEDDEGDVILAEEEEGDVIVVEDDGVLGRGGKRGAKSKPKKTIKKGKKSKEIVVDEESDLTDQE